jgi:hypothetical protein
MHGRDVKKHVSQKSPDLKIEDWELGNLSKKNDEKTWKLEECKYEIDSQESEDVDEEN